MIQFAPEKQMSMIYGDFFKGHTFRLYKSNYEHNKYLLMVEKPKEKLHGYSIRLTPKTYPTQF